MLQYTIFLSIFFLAHAIATGHMTQKKLRYLHGEKHESKIADGFWYDEIFEEGSRFGVKADKALFQGQSDFQQIDVLETEALGRVLAIDHLFMTSEKDEHFYHEMLVHPALVTAPSIKRVLVIGGGDGGTVREVLSYPEVKQVVMVEIDAKVIEVSKRHLAAIGTSWNDPRLEVIIGDGIDFAINAEVSPFDVVLLDGSDPVGPAKGLFTEGFYRGCARLLADGGVFALQSESPIWHQEVLVEIGRTLQRVFKRAYPYFGPVPSYPSGSWSWTYATFTVDPFAISQERAARQEGRCKYYNRDIHRGAFAIPNYLKRLYSKR
jgi:spermidine synthase